MRHKIDITGRRYGMLVAVRETQQKKGTSHVWECICDCGNTTYVRKGHLGYGTTKSCGCLKIKKTIERAKKHGKSESKAYAAHANMIQRCENPKSNGYKNYGGRGIKVCKRWHKFELFYKDMGDPPTKNHTLDRINNEADYCPSNCQWATWSQQAKNKRSNNMLTCNGVTKCVTQWSKDLGITTASMYKRLKTWPLEKALTKPARKGNWYRGGK